MANDIGRYRPNRMPPESGRCLCRSIQLRLAKAHKYSCVEAPLKGRARPSGDVVSHVKRDGDFASPSSPRATLNARASEPTRQHQDDHNQKSDTDAAAGNVAPASAMPPRGHRDHKHHSQHDKQNGEHGLPFFGALERQRRFCPQPARAWCSARARPAGRVTKRRTLSSLRPRASRACRGET